MQVDPIKPKIKPPGTKPLKLDFNEPLSNFAFEFNLRRYIKAICCAQRDYGRRDDRKMSRLKYLIASWGIDKFRSVAEQYYGRKFEPFMELKPFEMPTYLGWHEQAGAYTRSDFSST